MTKPGSSSSTKRTATAKSTSSPAKSRIRTVKNVAPALSSSTEPGPDIFAALIDRINTLEEKITTGFSSLIAEMQTLKATPPSASLDGNISPETFLPSVADLIRRNLIEQMTPIVAALKRIEERVGFIGNRLKHPPAGQEQRQKPWRHDQQQRHPRLRGHNGPRPPVQGQPWTPPFCCLGPRPLCPTSPARRRNERAYRRRRIKAPQGNRLAFCS